MPETFFEYAVSIGASKEILELLFEANLNETRDEQVSFFIWEIYFDIFLIKDNWRKCLYNFNLCIEFLY